MSVIAWDGKTLAADRMASSGNLIRTWTKIFKHGDMIGGGAGAQTEIVALWEWVKAGCVPEKFPRDSKAPGGQCSTLWVINRNGTVMCFEDSPFPLAHHDEIFAEGSGRDFAYGAMAMGADARRAVEIAIQYDKHCGQGVDTLSFEES